MDSDYRFNRDEISKILKRAAELEHKHNGDDDSEGLTVKELEQVSRDVGLHPKYIQLAVDEMRKPTHSGLARWLGGPFQYSKSDMATGTLTDDQWEEIVAEIRRIHGGIGKTSKLGNTVEWEQRKKEVGYVQISLAPKKDHTKIHINANYRYFATMVYIMTGILGFMVFAISFDETSLSFGTKLASIILGIPALFAGARFYLSNWMKRKRNTYHKLFNRFREMLSPADAKERDISEITIPESNADRIKEEKLNPGRGQTS